MPFTLPLLIASTLRRISDFHAARTSDDVGCFGSGSAINQLAIANRSFSDSASRAGNNLAASAEISFAVSTMIRLLAIAKANHSTNPVILLHRTLRRQSLHQPIHNPRMHQP